jgi:hypothetical protein
MYLPLLLAPIQRKYMLLLIGYIEEISNAKAYISAKETPPLTRSWIHEAYGEPGR